MLDVPLWQEDIRDAFCSSFFPCDHANYKLVQGTVKHFPLNQAKVILYEPSGPWSQRLSVFSVVLSGWEFLIPPGQKTNPSQVSSQQMLILIYLPRRMQSWVRLDGTEGHTNIQISAELGSNWRPCGWNAEILQLRQDLSVKSISNYPKWY